MSAPWLVEVVPHVLHDGLQPQPGLLCSGDDLTGRQEETIVPHVSEFKRERVLDAIVICPVDAAPASWICKSEESTIGAYFSSRTPSGFWGKGWRSACPDSSKSRVPPENRQP